MRTILAAIILALVCAGLWGLVTQVANAPGVMSVVGAVIIGAVVFAFMIAWLSRDTSI